MHSYALLAMENEFDTKKILALVGLVAAAAFIAYLIYAIFFKSPETEQTAEEAAQSQAGGLTTSDIAPAGNNLVATPEPTQDQVFSSAAEINPLSEGSKLVAVQPVITTPSAAVTLAGNGDDLQFYNKLDGKFYKTDAEGKQVALSPDAFPNVQNVAWAPNKNVAALSFPDGSKITYDFKEQKQYTIPKHWDNLKFSSDSAQLVGKSNSPDPQLRYLFTSNIDGTNATPIEPIGENGNLVMIDPSPNNQVLAFSRTAPPVSGGAERQGILLIGKNHENFRQLTVEGLGFQPQWSPQGDKILYSAYNRSTDLKPVLWVDGGTSDSVGTLKNSIPINTWASKCTFMSNDEAICAVPNPEKLIPGIGFAPQLATDTDDSIYKINLKSGLQTLIAKPDGNRTIEQLTVSEDDQHLFIKDQTTGEVLKMNLK